MASSFLSGTEPEELPLFYEKFITLPNGNYRLVYTQPGANKTVPVLSGILPISTEIVEQSKSEGGAEVKTIEISGSDYQKILERLKSPEELARLDAFKKFLGEERRAVEEQNNSPEYMALKALFSKHGKSP